MNSQAKSKTIFFFQLWVVILISIGICIGAIALFHWIIENYVGIENLQALDSLSR
tara:strand:- start:58984 stop:59148 length:165 start_codon:yes stop_codon:yes gene_type:complete